MHVAFILPRFYPYKGGYENHILSIAKHLVAAGNAVSVFTTTALDLEAFWLDGFRTLPPGRDKYDGIEISRFPISYRRWRRRAGRLLSFIPDWRLKAMFSRPGFQVDELEQALQASHPDIIHVGPLPYTNLMYTGVAVARRLKIPILCTPCTHFGEADNDEVSQHYIRSFQIEVLKRCNKVLALTQIEADRLSGLDVPRGKLMVSGAGIEPLDVTGGNGERFRAKYGISQPIVLHLGMKAADKGSTCVFESMKILWDKGVRAHLVMAGPSLSSFDDYIAEQKPQSVNFSNIGVFNDEEKRDLLAAADVVVQPSRVESLGLTLLEAWANQKPVIAADTPVSREIVEPDHDGLLAKFCDSPGLASTILRLLSDPATRTLMGIQGKEKVSRRFQTKNIMQGILPLFSTGTREKL